MKWKERKNIINFHLATYSQINEINILIVRKYALLLAMQPVLHSSRTALDQVDNKRAVRQYSLWALSVPPMVYFYSMPVQCSLLSVPHMVRHQFERFPAFKEKKIIRELIASYTASYHQIYHYVSFGNGTNFNTEVIDLICNLKFIRIHLLFFSIQVQLFLY